MKDVLSYIIKSITGSSDFEITEEEEEGRITFHVEANPDIIGLIIGKDGKTIKNIRKIVSIPATTQKTGVNITVTPK
ncbi:hypothetical protein A2801_02775 [Candidatus Woesebacteria bacterium RIFCSPHIGHO2_01_FULL_41_10]|uniref:Uncharacterized protein n=1 Tax=Candidatus Woesebacteria bacterium RIFCSPHIGHO2_01_FULL_41_10 TaxID=1802500 RepID=A0A1F7YNT7_9BACT|nr:MAG: hypothetical protein A2801_02775 [Candidatus Woesebacteria bacterium RIFCSPHIGHO2_01_FULL_41_10]